MADPFDRMGKHSSSRLSSSRPGNLPGALRILESNSHLQRGDEPSVEEISGSLSESSDRNPADATQGAILEIALTLVLKEIAREARSITNATGAAILLVRGGVPVCSSVSGSTAQEVSAYLRESSGVPDVSSREGAPQRCDDVETDSRFDLAICRRLGIRSFLAVPLQDNDQAVVAVVQTFSPFPQAFNNRDILALQGLGRRIVDNITLAEQSVASIEKTNENTGSKAAREKTPASSFARWLSGWKQAFLQERRNLAFITLIIGLSILLGWTLATTERSSVHRNSIAPVGPHVSNSAAAGPSVKSTTVVQVADQSAGSDGATTDASEVKVDNLQNQAKVEPHRTQKKSGHSSVSKPVTSDVSSSDVLIFENGRQIFPARLDQSEGLGDVAASNDPNGTSPESDDNKNSLSIGEDVAQEHVLKRVEPDYPESTREERLQGAVILNINVGSDGTVHGLSRISGDPKLTLLAAKAVRQWKFAPLVRDGAPVSFKTQITLNFALP